MRYFLLIALFLAADTSHASTVDVQLGVSPLVGLDVSKGDRSLSSGLGLMVSYLRPLEGYAIDIMQQCTWSDHEIALGSRYAQDHRARSCDLAVGLSYRVGYPFSLVSKSNFGFALGIAAGARQQYRYDVLRRTTNGIPIADEPNSVSYHWLARGHVSIRYAWTLFSLALYATASATRDGHEHVVVPSLGIMLTCPFQI